MSETMPGAAEYDIAVSGHYTEDTIVSTESNMLTGEANIRVAARMLADLGPKEIVLTHRGGLLVYANGQFHKDH